MVQNEKIQKEAVPLEIREYRKYCEADILRLYASVGWTAYTEQPETLRQAKRL